MSKELIDTAELAKEFKEKERAKEKREEESLDNRVKALELEIGIGLKVTFNVTTKKVYSGTIDEKKIEIVWDKRERTKKITILDIRRSREIYKGSYQEEAKHYKRLLETYEKRISRECSFRKTI